MARDRESLQFSKDRVDNLQLKLVVCSIFMLIEIYMDLGLKIGAWNLELRDDMKQIMLISSSLPYLIFCKIVDLISFWE